MTDDERVLLYIVPSHRHLSTYHRYHGITCTLLGVRAAHRSFPIAYLRRDIPSRFRDCPSHCERQLLASSTTHLHSQIGLYTAPRHLRTLRAIDFSGAVLKCLSNASTERSRRSYIAIQKVSKPQRPFSLRSAWSAKANMTCRQAQIRQGMPNDEALHRLRH
jgi:hypothetical protein